MIRPRHDRLGFLLGPAFVFVCFLALAGCNSESKSSMDNLVVAEVNGDPITQGEIRAAVMLNGGGTASEDEESFWRTLVEDLVERRLILQRSRSIGESVDEAEVQALVAFISRQYGSLEELENVLREEGIEQEDWENSIRETLAIEQVLKKEVYSKVEPTEELMRAYYEKNVDQFRMKKRWRVRQIVVQTEEEAKRLRTRLLAGAVFSKLAEEKSIGMNRSLGGDMGIFSEGQLPAAIESVIRKLKGNEVSPVIQTSSGHHLFQVTERRLAGVLPFREVREQIRSEMVAETGRKRFKEWISSLKDKSKIRYHWRNLRHVAAR